MVMLSARPCRWGSKVHAGGTLLQVIGDDLWVALGGGGVEVLGDSALYKTIVPSVIDGNEPHGAVMIDRRGGRGSLFALVRCPPVVHLRPGAHATEP